MQINKKQLETLFELNLSQKCIKLIDALDLNYSNLSQEDRDRHDEILASYKAEKKAELKKIRQEQNTPFGWIIRIAFFGGVIYFIFLGGLADLIVS